MQCRACGIGKAIGKPESKSGLCGPCGERLLTQRREDRQKRFDESKFKHLRMRKD